MDQPGETASIAWAGDVNIGRRFHSYHHENPESAGLANLQPLKQADLSIINLECVLANAGEPYIDKQERASYYFRARPELVQVLLDGHIDMVATANNHSGDYGIGALLEQPEHLDKASISHAGSGRNFADALKPAIRSTGALTVALFSIDMTQPSFAATDTRAGIAYLDPKNIKSWIETLRVAIEVARAQANIVLVATHWGSNNLPKPSPQKIQIGHAIIDAGADAVLGASAHMLQGIEIYKQRPIIHDAGDLLFDAYQRSSIDSGIFTLQADASGIRGIVFHPVKIGFCTAETLDGDSAVEATKRFAEKCHALSTNIDINPLGQGVLTLSPPPRAVLPRPALQLEKPILQAPQPRLTPLEEWTVSEIPVHARLPQPVLLGPLVLLGVTMTPETLVNRGLLYVESFWGLAQETTDDWRIYFQAHPDDNRHVKSWGQSSDHDPCDWMWPTSRWKMGQIYRDTYSLRPPSVKRWQDLNLNLSVQLKCKDQLSAQIKLPRRTRLQLNAAEAFSVMRASPVKYRITEPQSLAPSPEPVWTADQLQQITGGEWLVKPPAWWYVRSVYHNKNLMKSSDAPRPRIFIATNNKELSQHELFGKPITRNWDHHDALPELQPQIDAAIVSRPVPGLDPSLPLLKVDDPMRAMMELGAAGRQRLKGKVVAITGSSGKTSLGQMLTLAMSADQKVQTNSISNYNSRCGILHLLANTPPSTDFVALEVAVSAINAPDQQHIKIVRPDIAIITNIAPSHLPDGKDLSYVAQRKSNIFAGVNKGGWALIYRETEYFDFLARRADYFGLNVMTYGTGADADIRLLHYDASSRRIKAVIRDTHQVDYSLQADGYHMALNSLACVGVRTILGLELAPMLEKLSDYEAVDGRGKIYKIKFNDQQITVVDDAYNANPLSVRMALSVFDNMPATGRRVLILGDMLELGDQSVKYHLDLADPIHSAKPDSVILCGNYMKSLSESLTSDPRRAFDLHWYETSSEIVASLADHIIADDKIVVKASNSIKLGVVVDHLLSRLRI